MNLSISEKVSMATRVANFVILVLFMSKPLRFLVDASTTDRYIQSDATIAIRCG